MIKLNNFKDGILYTQDLKIENIPTNSIKNYKNTPKIHKNKQVQQILNSISELIFNNPILVDENNEIIAEHGRLLAAKQLRVDTVPVIKLLHLNEAQKKAYRMLLA